MAQDLSKRRLDRLSDANDEREMLDRQTRGAILQLSSRGHGARSISRLLSVSPGSARKIIHLGSDAVPQIRRLQKAARYRAQIVQLISDHDGNLFKVCDALCAAGATLSYSALTRFCRLRHLVDVKSNVTRSIEAAQGWLAEITHGTRSLEILQTELGASSDLATLLHHVKNGDLRERKKAATILARKRRIPHAIIAKILHASHRTTGRYFKIYSEAGPAALFLRQRKRDTSRNEGPKIKTKRILELLHHKPNLFGINRASWTQLALSQAYQERYKEVISWQTVARLIRKIGYKWSKARQVLTSPDPEYREKVELLLKTLRSLTTDELFFFLDEWGPVQVRKRGGKAYRNKDNNPGIPRHQTPKGTVSLAGALSATTNQVTWTFVTSKDSLSMMNLLELLYNQHHDKSKLYVTWDAVSWHDSIALTDWLDQFNATTSRESSGPVIELVPLPTSAQFLNVIEGVLSGMTSAVINNSDYQSSDDMKYAVSKHFTARNEYFISNPKRAGNKIWQTDFFHDFDALKAGDYLNVRGT